MEGALRARLGSSPRLFFTAREGTSGLSSQSRAIRSSWPPWWTHDYSHGPGEETEAQGIRTFWVSITLRPTTPPPPRAGSLLATQTAVSPPLSASFLIPTRHCGLSHPPQLLRPLTSARRFSQSQQPHSFQPQGQCANPHRAVIGSEPSLSPAWHSGPPILEMLHPGPRPPLPSLCPHLLSEAEPVGLWGIPWFSVASL